MSDYLSIDQCIALLPKDFSHIRKLSLRKAIYSSSKGKLYFKRSKESNLKQKTWAYNISPSVIKDEDISYIILAAGLSGIFVIPVEHFNSYRNRHPVGSRNSGEDFSILRKNNRMIRHESKCDDEDITQYFYPANKNIYSESKSRILFANIGWMISYNGQTITDKITGGGAYSDIDKHESFNFQNLNKKCYGYLQPTGDRIDLHRIDPTVSQNEEYLDNVLVVWFATNPIVGGSWVVGWYKNATVYRECQKSKASQRNGYGYYVKADVANCTLLPVDDRIKPIPRQIKNYPGRSNIWYADTTDVKTFKTDVISYIRNYKSLNRKHHKSFATVSTEARTRIEQAAIKVVWKFYEGRGYRITDVQSKNYGWDLEATNGRHRLFLEVKGQGNHEPYIRISRNENKYEQLVKNKGKYRLCVVMDSLNKADIYVFLPLNDDKWVCEDDDSVELKISEQVAAIATF